MKFFVFWLPLLLFAEVQAITWDFAEEGDAQGWRAKESNRSSSTSTHTYLRSEVHEGIWRIAVSPGDKGSFPAIMLTSPHLGFDSALFDRLSVRFRLIHSRPIEGGIQFTWVNETNRTQPGATIVSGGPEREYFFLLGQEVVYTTDWQEVSFVDLMPGKIEGLPPRINLQWEGELLEFRLDLSLSDRPPPENIEVPEAVEIDWIVLTGAEEQLQGEIPPLRITEFTPFGDLFGVAMFNPLGKKGIRNVPGHITSAGLGDLDGDHDLDLVSSYMAIQQGWLAAFNDGQGGFSHAIVQSSPVMPNLLAEDMNGDGLMDLLLKEIGEFRYRSMFRDLEEEWIIAQEFHDTIPLGFVDPDGDGEKDLVVWEHPWADTCAVWWLVNDGTGYFTSRWRVVFNSDEKSYFPRVIKYPAGVLWRPRPNSDQTPQKGYKVTYLDERGNIVQDHLSASIPEQVTHMFGGGIRYVGDVDSDSDLDLIVSKETIYPLGGTTYRGLDLMVNRGDGSFDIQTWYEDVILLWGVSVQGCDLNGDGLVDLVFTDSNERDPAVVVNLGRKGELPVQEGRYPLRGQGGTVLGGDVDGDNDVDLVVLEVNVEGQGGVHVLLNQSMERGNTAMTTELGDTPYAFRLGASYPNPFNPRTWIPFDLSADSAPVDLRIYNLLGQPVRTLVAGRLPVGQHVVPWDGRDQRGREVGSGVYLYRLQAGAWTATGKMVKSE